VLCDRRDYHEPVCLSEAEIVDPKYQKSLLIAILMQVFQQASGNSVIVYYCTILLHSMGRSSRDALLYNALACIPQLLVLVLVVFTLDKNGRRPALLISEVGIAVGLVIIGSATVMKEGNQRFWILLVGIVIHRAFFAAGMGPVPGVLVAETLPFPIRGRALSLSLAINWLCNYIVTASFPLLATWTHPSYVYWIFALVAFLGFLFISVVVEETKGVSLEKIEQRTFPEVPELQFTEGNGSLDENGLPRPCSPPSDLR
jgi:SP family xylose:H+ symportor-like MFS transporter